MSARLPFLSSPLPAQLLDGTRGPPSSRASGRSTAGPGGRLTDVGAGYSSLSYLHAFPVDTLKVDRSFVSCLDCDDGRRRIVEAIVRMAGSLGLFTVGEGVETRGQAADLRGLGCRLGQGYLFARPLVPGDARQLLDSGGTGEPPDGGQGASTRPPPESAAHGPDPSGRSRSSS